MTQTPQIPAFAFSDLNLCPMTSDTVEHDGFTLRATIYADDDADAPWDREDGHGVVSDWTSRAKAPGELILAESRPGGRRRFYDFAGACEIALADGWGVEGGRLEGESAKAYAARAARADFNRLKMWQDDQWQYVGVAVTVARDGVVLTGKYDHAVWGTESDAPDALAEIANELAPQALDAARAWLQSMAPVTQAGHIDLGMTWAGVAQIIALGLENGTDEGKRQAREHLDRMAATLAKVQPLLERCETFLAGFEDDEAQAPTVPALLADLRAALGKEA